MMTDDDPRTLAIRRIEAKRSFWTNLVTYVVVNALLWVIWLLTKGSGTAGYWPIWTTVFWGFGVIMHAWKVFGQKPISEDDIRREMGRTGGTAAGPGVSDDERDG